MTDEAVNDQLANDQNGNDPAGTEKSAVNRRDLFMATGAAIAAAATLSAEPGISSAAAQPASGKQPNIVAIMGDDVGWFNIGAYHRGMMAGRTPNLDRLAAEGMLFTDYYAEASCTAGRANFITGELPIRTGPDHGRPGRRRRSGCQTQAPTIATALRSDGLRHRAVRQESPRRHERIPADGARLR